MNALDQINWRKKDMVAQCIQIAREEKNIKRMIIFGSSVTDACRDDSDIDICLDMRSSLISSETCQTLARMTKACGLNCDILFYPEVKGRLKEEIDNKGVTVYVS